MPNTFPKHSAAAEGRQDAQESATRSEFPPRGTGEPGRIEAPPASLWGYPEDLGENWDWKPGKVLLGRWGDRLIGDPDRVEEHDGRTVVRLGDDRHIVTIAGSRAGKSRTVLLPNLRRYPGAMFVIDPKGELARETALLREEKFGQESAVLDPFDASGLPSASYNPLDELNPAQPALFHEDRQQHGKQERDGEQPAERVRCRCDVIAYWSALQRDRNQLAGDRQRQADRHYCEENAIGAVPRQKCPGHDNLYVRPVRPRVDAARNHGGDG